MARKQIDVDYLLIPGIFNNLMKFSMDLPLKIETDEVYSSILDYSLVLFNETKMSLLYTINEEKNKLVLNGTRNIAHKHIKKKSISLDKDIYQEIFKKGYLIIENNQRRFSEIIYKNILIKKKVKTVIYLPLKHQDTIYGLIKLYFTASEHVTQLYASILGILARQAAVAIRNAKMYQHLLSIAESKTRQFITLKELTESLSRRKSLTEILTHITKESLNIVGHGKKVAFVMLIDKQKNMLETKAASGELFRKEHLKFNIHLNDRSIVTWVARNAKPRLARNVEKDAQYKKITWETKSEICIPLLFRNEVIGVLDIESSELSAFDDQDKELLQTLAENTSIAIKIAELYDIRIKQLEALFKTGTKISSSLKLNEVLKTISNEALKAIKPKKRTVFVQLINKETGIIEVNAACSNVADEKDYIGTTIKVNEGISRQVIKNKTYYLCPDVKADPYYFQINPKVKSELCVPIIFGDKVIGLINVESLEPNDFGVHEIQLLEGLANQAGVAIENARLNRGLANTQYELTQALEIAIIGETLEGLTHDIRTGFSLISGETQWLDRLIKENKISHVETKKSIKKIESYVNRIDRLTDDLSKRSQQLPPTFQPANLIDTIKECFHLLSSKIDRRSINIKEQYNSYNLIAEVDVKRIKRVFINLIMNCIEALPEDGIITIKAFKENENIKIKFIDNGVGISKENLQRIWDNFFTTKPDGSGVGLAVCKRIIEFDFNGKLEIRSKKFSGTEVFITLPIKQKNKSNR